MKSLWIIGAISFVFTTSDGVYLPLRIIAGFGLLVSLAVALSIVLGKVSK